jgi:peroxiredoxin
VGEVAPDFHLQDQTGAERSLKGLLSGGKVALVLYRSADW